MAIGKNAKKRAARRAFHDAKDNDAGAMPYSFKVVEYRDNQRRVLTFASLSSYKEYRERFFSSNPVGTLSLVNPLTEETVSDDRGKASRSAIINKGQDTSKAKPKGLASFKGKVTVESVKGGRFRPEGFKVTQEDVRESLARDREKQEAIKAEKVRRYDETLLRQVRLKHSNV